MDDLTNRYGISYNQMLHDLAILKMQHMDSLSIALLIKNKIFSFIV